MEELDDFEETFHAATEFVKANVHNFKQDSLLKLYARFKQVKTGPCKTKKPGLFDFEGKSKWEAWKSLGTMGKDQAMKEYVQVVSGNQPDWEAQLKPSEKSKPAKQIMLGVAVSTMVNPEGDIDDELKTIFDWCKDGNTRKVASLLDGNKNVIDIKDNEGMTLLHWACDRGDSVMVETLLQKRATIDIQDAEGQTPLHFAVICEHPEIVRLLLSRKASTTVQDCDGQTVRDLDTTSEIKTILSSHIVR